MDLILYILLIILLALLILGLIFLIFLLIRFFEKALSKANSQNFEVLNNINMRLISILTETISVNPPMTQNEIDEHHADIKAQDDEIVKQILNPTASPAFNPFATQTPPINPTDPMVDQIPVPPNEDILAEQSAVYKSPDQTKKE